MNNKRAAVFLVITIALVIFFAGFGIPYGKLNWRDTVSSAKAGYGSSEDDYSSMLEVPEGSVVGSFITDATLYWKPDLTSSSGVVVEVTEKTPKTAWVIGMDKSGKFYKIIWASNYMWVLASTMSPNPDEVWENTPLPTHVVD